MGRGEGRGEEGVISRKKEATPRFKVSERGRGVVVRTHNRTGNGPRPSFSLWSRWKWDKLDSSSGSAWLSGRWGGVHGRGGNGRMLVDH